MKAAAKFGGVLVLLGLIVVATAAPEKRLDKERLDKTTFIVKTEKVLAPLIPVTLEVELLERGKEGSNVLAKGDVLQCKPFTRVSRVIATDKTAHVVHQMALECADGQIWIVKGILFEK